MFNALDLLVVVFMILAAASLLAMVLMFLIKNKYVRRVCLYIVAALGLYIGYVGIRIHFPGFYMGRMVLAGLLALTSVGAFVLERVGHKNPKLFLLARILAAAALVMGIINAFF